MSKFDLRDISERLTGSSDTEAVVFEFIGYLQSVHRDWRAALAFYEVSQDALVSVYERDGNRLVRRDVSVPADQLPTRLVRKFFHPGAIFNQPGPRFLLSQWLRTSPFYEPEPIEAASLAPLAPVRDWRSCLCMPLADRDDVLALLVLASHRKNAFGGRIKEDLVPIKNVAALALAQHLHRTARNGDGEALPGSSGFHERLRAMGAQTLELEQQNRAKAQRLATLEGELGRLEKHTTEYQQELERVKGTVLALEEQSAVATDHLSEAFTELNAAQSRIAELDGTVEFVHDVLRRLAEEHDPDHVPAAMAAWLGERFAVERCSLMVPDAAGETLRIAAQRGMDPEVAARVKVRVGQGVAGWVASHRKPLFVRVRDEAPGVQRMVKETYNSDSFVSVPLIHNGRLLGVLNLSNRCGGESFQAADLDRATIAGSVLAIALGSGETARRMAA